MFFKQIKYRGDNFSYIIADDKSREAAVIDPSFNVEAIILMLKNENLKLKYIINTHGHMDHTAGNNELKRSFPSKIIAHKLSTSGQDINVVDNENLKLDGLTIHFIHTPGHTRDSMCILVDGKLMTGDTLFVGECGRTDLPGSSPKDMYMSLQKLAKLDGNIEVYPGHDYGESPSSTIAKERQTNYTLQPRTLEEFIRFMQTP